MHVEYVGEYEHSLFSTFDHEVTSGAIAKAYVNMGDVFDQDCSENGVACSWGQGFECELYIEEAWFNSEALSQEEVYRRFVQRQ